MAVNPILHVERLRQVGGGRVRAFLVRRVGAARLARVVVPARRGQALRWDVYLLKLSVNV